MTHKFAQEIDLNDREAMVEFLTSHYRYWTGNSWNKGSSYANKMKLYHLGLSKDVLDSAYAIIDQGDFQMFAISDMFDVFEEEHKGFTLGTNGRSGGYFVLYSGTGTHGLDENESFEDWEDEQLRRRVQVVCDFDKLCDALVEELIDWTQRYKVEEHTVMVTKQTLVLVEKE